VKRNNDNTGNYETGYGKPPANTRFKRGQSGNSKGRPKGSRGFVSIFNRTLKERLTINEGGRRKVISKLEGIFKQLVNRAVSGDTNSLRLIMPLLQLLEQQANDQHKAAEHVEEADGEMIAAVQEELVEIYKNGGFDK
jgi:hypothetical protein